MCQVSGWPCSRGPRQPAVLNMGHIYTVAYLAPHEKRDRPNPRANVEQPFPQTQYIWLLFCCSPVFVSYLRVWEQAPAQGPGLA